MTLTLLILDNINVYSHSINFIANCVISFICHFLFFYYNTLLYIIEINNTRNSIFMYFAQLFQAHLIIVLYSLSSPNKNYFYSSNSTAQIYTLFYFLPIIFNIIISIVKMGATQVVEAQKNFYDNLVFVRSLDVSKSLMKDPQSNQLFAVVQHTFPSQQQMHKFSEQLQRRKQVTHQYYMSPIKQLVLCTSNLCSKQHKAVQIFRWQQYSLWDQINSRKQQSKQFSDREIWSILCSCVLTMSFFTKNEILHTTLHPKDIILTNQGQVKILAAQLSEFGFDYHYKHGFYYAPEALKAINTRALYNLTNKAAVFTLGMSILSVMSLSDLSFVYKDGKIIDFVQIRNLVEKIKNDEMRNVLSKMLKPAHYERISFTELQEMLYEILQNSEMLSETEPEPEHHQIEKLEESIYRLKTRHESTSQPSSEFKNLCASECDEQDEPNKIFSCSTTDIQQMDEQDNGTKAQQKTAENSRTDKHSNYEVLKGPLIDKSNSVQISESLKISDQNKKLDYLSGIMKTSRQSGPYYVTEQYSRGRFQGYKENGMRHGFGTFYYEDGGRYSGQWCKNKMQGRGALYYVNGQLAYEGEWNQDQLHGYGVLYNENPVYITENIDWKHLDQINCCWVKYEGNFSQDMKYGEGTLYLSNGEYFRGDFKNDLPNGKGLFRALNNHLIKGSWRDGIFEKLQS